MILASNSATSRAAIHLTNSSWLLKESTRPKSGASLVLMAAWRGMKVMLRLWGGARLGSAPRYQVCTSTGHAPTSRDIPVLGSSWKHVDNR